MRQLLVIINISILANFSSGQSYNNDILYLPDRFPEVNVMVYNDPCNGYIFAAPMGEWGPYSGTDPYLVIYDNHGLPVFYQEQAIRAFDFKLHSNGILSYFGGTLGYGHHGLNDKFEHIRNYYPVDVVDDSHEFLMYPDSSYFMLGIESRIVDMDTVVEGGHPGVIVDGNVVQYFDSNDSLLFNWNSWDHFSLFDGSDYMVDLTDSIKIDLVHANSIEKDSDTTILLSCRNMDEVTKINMVTGEIVWRLGGKNNMFEFQHDTCIFHMQHDVRKLVDGRISIHDNSHPIFMNKSRGLIYIVNEQAKTVELVNTYPQNYPGFKHGEIMGNTQILSDSSAFIGWGSGSPNITEYKSDGSTALVFDYSTVSYRAFKFDWHPKAITFSENPADFDTIVLNQTSLLKTMVFNNLEEEVKINYIHQYQSDFDLVTQLPITINPNDSTEIVFEITPLTEGIFEDTFTLCWDTTKNGFNQRIGGQLQIKAIALQSIGLFEKSIHGIQVYPNPFCDFLMIDLIGHSGTVKQVKIFDAFGKIVLKKSIRNQFTSNINTCLLVPGIYQIEITTDKGPFMQTLVKH